MEVVEAGYKMTEMGLIPTDWVFAGLIDICDLVKAKINPQSEKENFKCIELEHLDQGTGQLLGYSQSQNLLSQKTIFKSGDVLFGKLRPYLRKYLLATFDGVCTSEIWVLRPKYSCGNSYLYYLIQSDRIIDAANASTGTKMPRAEWSVVSQVKLPLPPSLTEQKAIATALSDVDALISGLDKLIEKKKAIKQGAMQELLTGKTRLAGFGNGVGYKMTEVGRIPGDWELNTLGDVGEVKMCKRIFNHQTSSRGEVPFYKIGTFGKEPDAYISKELYEDFKKRFSFPKKGHILISASGTIGRTVIFRGENAYYQDSNIIWLENDESMITNDFLYYVLKIIKYNTEGSTIKRLYNNIIKSSKFILPSTILEQQAIATTLSDIDKEIDELEIKMNKYKQIKQGMMQELLTGKTRLV